MKKTILIATPMDYGRDWSAFPYTVPPSPPLGILSVGSYLAAQDVPVEIIDVAMDFGFGLTRAAERVVEQRLACYLHRYAQDIAWIGISQLSNTESGVALAREIHALLPDIPIIFGGYFPSNSYRALLEMYPFITAVVRGDGEVAALEISHSLAEGSSFLSDRTPNLAWLDGSEIRATPVQPVALDNLPILDFQLLRHPDCYLQTALLTSRGCPCACSYCLEPNMRPYATYPITWVDRQLKHLETVVPNNRIFILDPIFGVGQKRTLEVCQVLRERRFNYMVEARVDVLSPDLVPALHAAGVQVIYWGLESASAGTLLRMNKVKSIAQAEAYVRDSFRVLEACFENQVTPLVGVMVGFPGDTEADYQATLTYVKEVKQLHERVAAQTGSESGFVLTPFSTKVYEGSLLANIVEKDLPGVVLQDDPFIGSKGVLWSSPESDSDMASHYIAEISKYSIYTPIAIERMQKYMLFALKAFVEGHPESTDEEGVTTFGDNLRRFPHGYVMSSDAKW